MSNRDIDEIHKGSSSKVYKFTSKSNTDLSSADWTGKVVVREAVCDPLTNKHAIDPNGATLINKTIAKNSANDAFLAYLTPSETDTLTVDTEYILVAEMTNLALTIPINIEKHIPIKIIIQGAV